MAADGGGEFRLRCAACEDGGEGEAEVLALRDGAREAGADGAVVYAPAIKQRAGGGEDSGFRHARGAGVARELAARVAQAGEGEAVAAAVLLALGQFFLGRGINRPFRIDSAATQFSRTSGFFGLHLTQGGVMGMLTFLLIALTYDMKKIWRWLPTIVSAVGAILSGARAASLGLAVAITAFFAIRGRRFIVFGMLAGTVFVVCGFTLLYLTQPKRFENLIHLKDGRWPIWRTSWQVALDHPLIGTGGSDQFQTAYKIAYPKVVPDIRSEFPAGAPHAHNTQLSHAAEHGLPFAILWLVMLVTPLLSLWRQRDTHPEVFRAAVGLVAVALFFGQFEKLDGECSRVLWTGLGLLLALASHAPSAIQQSAISRLEHAPADLSDGDNRRPSAFHSQSLSQ